MTNFARFHHEAVGVRGFDNVSNYSMDNFKCFWCVITYEAVALFHIGTTYTCKLYSLLQFTFRGLVNDIFKYKPVTRLLF